MYTQCVLASMLCNFIVGSYIQMESDTERAKLLGNTDTLKRASASVGRAQAISGQTDEIAVNILEDLDDQKTSLLRTRNKVSFDLVIPGMS